MIDLLLDEDQQALLDATTAFLVRELPAPSLHPSPDGFDRALWDRCAELGWYSLALDEADGGMGLSLVEEILLCREIGRRLMPLPFLSTLTATRLASRLGDANLMGELAAGKLVVGLAERHLDGRTLAWDSVDADATLLVDHLEGSVQLVQGLTFVEQDAESTIDPHVRLVPVLSEPPATVLLDGGAHSDDVIVYGCVLTAAMLSGIAEQTRDDSVGYAKYRVQYGKPIGAFQAVKHRCADMALRAERAWAQTMVAALQIRAGGSSAKFEGLSAKVVASQAAVYNSRDNIQNHGGIGFTSEHSAHLFLKRAHVLDFAFGTSRQYLPRLIDLDARW